MKHLALIIAFVIGVPALFVFAFMEAEERSCVDAQLDALNAEAAVRTCVQLEDCVVTGEDIYRLIDAKRRERFECPRPPSH